MDKSNNYWVSLSLDGIAQAIKQVPKKYSEHEKYGKQLSADLKIWEDGTASISIWDKDKEERIRIGTVRVSQFSQEKQAAPAAVEQAGPADFDSPF